MPQITLTIDIPEESARRLMDGRGIALISTAYLETALWPPIDAVPKDGPHVQWQPLAFLRHQWDVDANDQMTNRRIEAQPWKLSSMFTLAMKD